MKATCAFPLQWQSRGRRFAHSANLLDDLRRLERLRVARRDDEVVPRVNQACVQDGAHVPRGIDAPVSRLGGCASRASRHAKLLDGCGSYRQCFINERGSNVQGSRVQRARGALRIEMSRTSPHSRLASVEPTLPVPPTTAMASALAMVRDTRAGGREAAFAVWDARGDCNHGQQQKLRFNLAAKERVPQLSNELNLQSQPSHERRSAPACPLPWRHARGRARAQRQR